MTVYFTPARIESGQSTGSTPKISVLRYPPPHPDKLAISKVSGIIIT